MGVQSMKEKLLYKVSADDLVNWLAHWFAEHIRANQKFETPTPSSKEGVSKITITNLKARPDTAARSLVLKGDLVYDFEPETVPQIMSGIYVVKINCLGIGEGRTEMVIHNEWEALSGFLVPLWKEVDETFEKEQENKSNIEKPRMPAKPTPGSSLYIWLEWYNEMKKTGFHITFKMLAEESGYAPNTFKQAHRIYKIKKGTE